MLIIKRIHVEYRGLTIPDEHRATVTRVHGFHARGCPVYRSLAAAIAITTSLRADERDP